MHTNTRKYEKKYFFLLFLTFFISACSNSDEYEAQGYVEGKYTYLSVPQSGQLKTLSVERGTSVKTGAPVFTLDPQPELSQLEQAKQQVLEADAQFEQAKAALWLAEKTLTRNRQLYKDKAVAKSDLDNAQSQYEQAKARFTQTENQQSAAKANLEQARWAFNQKTVAAPKNAQVFDTYYLPGEFVPAGRPVLSLLAPADIKVIFYVSEPVLARLKWGDIITVTCDGCPTEPALKARIRFVSPQNEYTPPVIFSSETRQKLVYRIEAEPLAENTMQLRPGQPVTVTSP